MKIQLTGLFMIAGLALAGCDRSLTEEERKLVGCYEKIVRLPVGSDPHSLTNKLVLFENGKVESYENGKWGGHFQFATEWNKVEKEVHVFENPITAAIFKIEPNGDLTYFSEINLGMRVGMSKKYHDTYKKTSEKPKPRKVVPANIGNPILEKEVRKELEKPKGELTEADLEKVGMLSLQRNQLTEVPKELEKLTELWALDLSYNNLSNVKGLEKLTQLKELWNLKLDDNKLTSVKGLEKLTPLKFLSLSGNQLTDVKGLGKLPKLHTLELDDNKLTEVPKGLEKLTQLLYLYLRDNKLTDVKGLEKLTQLGHLQLGGNPDLSKAQIDQLQKALPKCLIYSDPTK